MIIVLKNNRKWMQIVILLIVAIVGGITIGSSLMDGGKIPRAGDRAPNFVLEGLDGSKHQLSDYKGKVILINFWGSFCPPCVREMPAIQRQYEKNKDRNFVVLGVNLDESLITVRGFARQHQLEFPILLDHNAVRQQYGVSLYPSSFFVNPDGRIEVMREGEMTEAFIEQTLSRMLSK